ncbi:MAG: cytochrome c oxidase subunit II, partial [Chloroflexota bacterium]
MSSRRSAATSFLSLVLVGVFALFITSCSGKDPQDTLSAVGEVAKKQQELFWIIFSWAALVFVLVQGLLLFILFRFRRRSENEMPAQTHGNTKLEIAWTLAPVLILISVAIPTVASVFDLAKEHDVSMRVKVVGHQWWWEFQYPGLGVVTANELHLPVGEVVTFDLESADVIHSFWVPKLAGKQDAIPGRT